MPQLNVFQLLCGLPACLETKLEGIFFSRMPAGMVDSIRDSSPLGNLVPQIRVQTSTKRTASREKIFWHNTVPNGNLHTQAGHCVYLLFHTMFCLFVLFCLCLQRSLQRIVSTASHTAMHRGSTALWTDSKPRPPWKKQGVLMGKKNEGKTPRKKRISENAIHEKKAKGTHPGNIITKGMHGWHHNDIIFLIN